jgi:hypothetical protein
MEKNGGSAFPGVEYYDEKPVGHFPGMTLLEYYAGKALAHISQPILDAMSNGNRPPTSDEIAGIVYQIAESMIAEKKRREQ